MLLLLNGKETAIDKSVSTLDQLFEYLDISPKMKIVELNSALYKESDFSFISIKDGDKIEIVQFMGGGL
jgi:sulfur carrier protein